MRARPHLVPLFVLALTAWANAGSITVQAGDTLWTLAQRHGVTVDELMATNGLDRPDLHPGDVLTLPGSEGPDAAPATWTVEPGDTLYDIAIATDTTVDELLASNGLQNADLHPGDVLVLPGGDATVPAEAEVAATDVATAEAATTEADANEAPASAPETAEETAEATTEAPPAPAATWTVEAGDTLYEIAIATDTTVDELLATNGLASADLHPGDVLKLPPNAVVPDGADVVTEASTAEPQAAAETATTDTAATDSAATGDTWTVEPGDTLYDIARATGTSVGDLLAWNALPGSTIRPGDVLALGPDGSDTRLEPLTVQVGPGDSLWRIARLNDTTPAAIASANGIRVDAVLQPGDVLTIPGAFLQAGAQTDRGGFAAPTITVDPGDTLWEIALRYDTTVEALMAANGLANSVLQAGQELRVVAADGRSAPVAVAAEPSGAVANAMVWPLEGPITSRFGWRALRIGGSNMHYGLDIDGHTGDPIVSATHGTVTYADWMGGFGKLVIIERDGTEYYYAHASELLVRVGQSVAPGSLIARVGTTGRVTGSHLHFEIRVDGTPLDPLPILEARASSR